MEPWVIGKRTVGFIRHDAAGEPVYVIRKQIGTHRYTVSTGKHDEREALLEWLEFQKDPAIYSPDRRPRWREPVRLDLGDKDGSYLIREFLDWSRKPSPEGAGNTHTWVHDQRVYLEWWAKVLGPVDLRKVTTEQIVRALGGQPARYHRLAVLRRLYSWLRRVVHRISTAEDPVYGQLSIPPPEPAQWKKSKVIPDGHFELAREHLAEPWRSMLDVQAGTGAHVTEVMRFAAGGSVEPVPPGRNDDAASVLVFPEHKSGGTFRVAVTQETAEAAERVLKHGTFSRKWYEDAIKGACKAAHIPTFTPARLRHTIATRAVNSGASVAAVGAFLHHRSPRTTARWYATLAAPEKINTLR
jgi:integrase